MDRRKEGERGEKWGREGGSANTSSREEEREGGRGTVDNCTLVDLNMLQFAPTTLSLTLSFLFLSFSFFFFLRFFSLGSPFFSSWFWLQHIPTVWTCKRTSWNLSFSVSCFYSLSLFFCFLFLLSISLFFLKCSNI